MSPPTPGTVKDVGFIEMPGRRGHAFVLLLAGALTACGDSSGNGSAAGWGPPQLLGTGSYVGSLAGDGNGRAVLVWIAPGAEDTGASIVSRRFAPGTGWAPLETLDPPGPNLFQNPVAATDTQGAAMAVWPDTSAVLASRFVSGSGWSAPAPISHQFFSRIGLRASPAVGFYAGGRALAAWSESRGGSGVFEIGSNRFDPATGWLSPEVVWAVGAWTVGPALAVSASGFSLAVWAEQRREAWGLWMSTFDPRRGWAVSQPVGFFQPDRVLHGLQVALNDTGTGFAFWTHADVVFASRYTTTTGFATPEALGRGGCDGLAVDAAGNALALMVEPPRLLARRYAAGRGWEPPESLPAQDAPATGAMSMDAGGNAWFVWTEATGVWSRRYLVGQGLGPAERISPTTGLGSRVVADAQGGAVAVWLEKIADRDDYTIMASRYTR